MKKIPNWILWVMSIISIIIFTIVFYTTYFVDSLGTLNIVFNTVDWIGFIFAMILFTEAIYLFQIKDKKDKNKWWVKKILALSMGLGSILLGFCGVIIIWIIKNLIKGIIYLIKWAEGNIVDMLIGIIIILIVYIYFMLNKKLYRWLKK